MKTQKYYKVVLVKDNKKLSFTARQKKHPYAVYYKVHRYVSAIAGGLLVFTNLESAKEFVTNNELCEYPRLNLEIWRVLVREPVKLPAKRLVIIEDFENLLSSVWNDVSFVTVRDFWPDNTAAFRQVRLEEKISYNK